MEASSAAQTRFDRSQAAVKDLQTRFDAATRSASDEARKAEAAIKQSNANNRDLTERLAAAEARIRELGDELERAKNETAHRRDSILSASRTRASDSSASDRAGEERAPERRDQLELFRASTPTHEIRLPEAGSDDANDPEPALSPEDPPASGLRIAPELEAGDATADAAGEPGEMVLPPGPSELPEPRDSDKPRAIHHPRPAAPVNPAELRKAIHQILPLLTDGDPGAKDCFKDNRAAFRSAFAPEAYEDFEQKVKNGDFSSALELLKRTAKKRGVSI
jgi:hypothetical protein